MTYKKLPSRYALPAIIISTLLVAIVISAWQEPASAPPSGNASSSLTVSSVAQYREGPLRIGGVLQTDQATFLARWGGNVGIGTTSTEATLHIVSGNDGTLKIGTNSGTAAQLCLNNQCFTKTDLLAIGGGGKSKAQYFASSGTFNVPTGVTLVWVTLWGGGGSGGSNTGGGGGSGELIYRMPLIVSGNVTVTIGAGGVNGNGGASSFGSLSAAGGKRGGDNGSSGGGGGGTLGGSGGTRGANSIYVIGGSGGGNPSSGNGASFGQYAGGQAYGAGAGGAAGYQGSGGWALSGTKGQDAAANSGAGGGGGDAGVGNSGGAGGSGGVFVEWVE